MAPVVRAKALIASSLFLFLPSLLFLGQPTTRIGGPAAYGGLRGFGVGGWRRRGAFGNVMVLLDDAVVDRKRRARLPPID